MLPASGAGYAPVQRGFDTFEMFERARAGQLAVLSIFGANPARNAPDPAAAAQALERIPFVVVSDLFMTETAQRATLVLPAAGACEKSGTTLNATGQLLPVNASLQPPESSRCDFEMLAGLADGLDVTLPSSHELERAIVAAAAKEPNDFTLGDERFATRGGGDLAESAGPRILSGGGTWLHDPTLTGVRNS
jgi:predicted molibdopterin-dependent oxidoreductase YjgC